MSYCQPYQPLPISTGASGLDRCGNVVAYAAPSVVQAPVGWGCWPIQFQGWWLYQGGVCPPGWTGSPGYPGYPGWGGGAPWGWWFWQWVQSQGIDPGFSAPPWWGPWQGQPAAWTEMMSGGAGLANWMISQRQRAATPAAQRRAA